VKLDGGLSNSVSTIIRRYIYIYIYRSYKVCCLYGFFVCHILPYSFGSIYHCIYICMFCMLLFNFVNYVFYCCVYVFLLLLCSVLCILFRCVVLSVVGV